MRVLILSILLFLSFKLFAECDTLRVITTDQYNYKPEIVSNGDTLHHLVKSPAYLRASSLVTFELLDNYGGALGFNSTTRGVYVVDSSLINGTIEQTDTVLKLPFRTTDLVSGKTEVDTFHLHFKEADSCVFVDPDYAGTESGTFDQPYNDIDDFTITPHIGIFCKGGTTILNETTVISSMNATEESPLIIGAYGNSNAIFNGIGIGGTQCFTIGVNGDVSQSSSYVYFSDLSFINHDDFTTIKMEKYSDYIGLFNCYFLNNDGDVVYPITSDRADSTSVDTFYFNNCTFDTTLGLTHVKVDYGRPFFDLCTFGYGTTGGYGIRLATGNGGHIKNCYFNPRSNDDACVQLRIDNVLFENLVMENGGYGIYATGTDLCYEMPPDDITIRNVYVKNMDDGGIVTHHPAQAYYPYDRWLIEDCLVKNVPVGYRFRECTDAILRRSAAINTTTYGFYQYDFGSGESLRNKVYSCVFVEASGDAFRVDNADGFTATNNTIIGNVYMVGDTIMNSIISGGITGSGTEITNLESWSESLFIDSASYDFRLKFTDTEATGQATLISGSWFDNQDNGKDEFNLSTPSIGAFENWGEYFQIKENTIEYKIMDGSTRYYIY